MLKIKEYIDKSKNNGDLKMTKNKFTPDPSIWKLERTLNVIYDNVTHNIEEKSKKTSILLNNELSWNKYVKLDEDALNNTIYVIHNKEEVIYEGEFPLLPPSFFKWSIGHDNGLVLWFFYKEGYEDLGDFSDHIGEDSIAGIKDLWESIGAKFEGICECCFSLTLDEQKHVNFDSGRNNVVSFIDSVMSPLGAIQDPEEHDQGESADDWNPEQARNGYY